ncbi:MAG: PAS domain S-box protein [Sphingosinicella sp.]|nr:PAS domain S-box protein [Sphingosinicella sp.]
MGIFSELRSAQAPDASVFERIFFGCDIPLAQLGLDGSFLIVNEGFSDLTGYSGEELLASGLQQLVHPDDLNLLLNQESRVLDLAPHKSIARRLICNDRSIVWINLTVALERGAQGKPDFFIAVGEKIDAARSFEVERPEEEAHMRTAVDAVPVGIVFAEIPSGKIVGGNKHLEQVLGRSMQYSLEGYSFDECVSYHADGTLVEESEYPLARIARGEESPSIDVNYRRDDGTLSWVRFIARAVTDSAGNLVGGVVASIGIDEERKAWDRMSREVKSLEDQLIHTSRVNAMDTMAGMLAHELNQPLTAAANYLAGAKKLLETPADIILSIEGIEAAQQAILRAGLTITSIRQMVSGKSGRRQKTQVQVLVEDSIRLLSSSLTTKPTIEIESRADSICVQTVQIEQVLLNLIRNASEAIHDQDDPFIKILATGEGSFVEISVSDSGSGVPEEIRTDIFSPFKSTRGNGLGIGLSICRTIVEQHGGRIWLDETGGPTTFKFTVPRNAPGSIQPAMDKRN